MKNSNNGFTLVEIIVSIAILSIMAVSIFSMFNTSSKVNKKAKDIDKANVIAVTSAEKVKDNPKIFIENADKVDEKQDSNDKNIKITVATLKKCYDEEWKEINDKSKTKYTVDITVIRKETQGDAATYRPKVNRTNSGGGKEFTDKIENSNSKYLIVVIDVPEYVKDHNYETYVLKGFDEKKFQNYLYNEYKHIFNEQHKKDCNGYEYDSDGNYKICTDHDDVYTSRLLPYGEDLIRFYALRDIGGNYDKVPEGDTLVQGSIPMYLNIEESRTFDTYNIEVVNTTKRDFDIYMPAEKINNKLNFITKEGVVNTTYISSERKKTDITEINVKVIRNSDKKEIVNYKTNKYESS